MSDDTVTISAKVSKDFQKQLDQIGEKLGVTNRSNVIRSGLEYFIDAFNLGRIPAVFRISKEKDSQGQVRTKVQVYPGIGPYRVMKREGKKGD